MFMSTTSTVSSQSLANEKAKFVNYNRMAQGTSVVNKHDLNYSEVAIESVKSKPVKKKKRGGLSNSPIEIGRHKAA